MEDFRKYKDILELGENYFEKSNLNFFLMIPKWDNQSVLHPKDAVVEDEACQIAINAWSKIKQKTGIGNAVWGEGAILNRVVREGLPE